MGKRLDFDIGAGRRNAVITLVNYHDGTNGNKIVDRLKVRYDAYEANGTWSDAGGTDTIICRNEPKHIIYGVIEKGAAILKISEAMKRPILPKWELYVKQAKKKGSKDKETGMKFVKILEGLASDIAAIARAEYPEWIGKMELKQVVTE